MKVVGQVQVQGAAVALDLVLAAFQASFLAILALDDRDCRWLR